MGNDISFRRMAHPQREGEGRGGSHQSLLADDA